MVQEGGNDIRQFLIDVDLIVIFVLIGEQIAAVEWVLQLETALLNARDIVRLEDAQAQRVEFEQRGISVGVVALASAVWPRVLIREKCIYENPVLLAGIHGAYLGNGIDQTAAAGTSGQAAANMKGNRRCSSGFHLLDQSLHLLAILAHHAGKEETPQAPLLSAHDVGCVG